MKIFIFYSLYSVFDVNYKLLFVPFDILIFAMSMKDRRISNLKRKCFNIEIIIILKNVNHCNMQYKLVRKEFDK